jgi:hypothetical protein
MDGAKAGILCMCQEWETLKWGVLHTCQEWGAARWTSSPSGGEAKAQPGSEQRHRACASVVTCGPVVGDVALEPIRLVGARPASAPKGEARRGGAARLDNTAGIGLVLAPPGRRARARGATYAKTTSETAEGVNPTVLIVYGCQISDFMVGG